MSHKPQSGCRGARQTSNGVKGLATELSAFILFAAASSLGAIIALMLHNVPWLVLLGAITITLGYLVVRVIVLSRRRIWHIRRLVQLACRRKTEVALRTSDARIKLTRTRWRASITIFPDAALKDVWLQEERKGRIAVKQFTDLRFRHHLATDLVVMAIQLNDAGAIAKKESEEVPKHLEKLMVNPSAPKHIRQHQRTFLALSIKASRANTDELRELQRQLERAGSLRMKQEAVEIDSDEE